MTFFSRAVLLFICGIVQIFFAAHLLFDWNILDLPSDLMFIPGILVLFTWAILSLDYHFGNKDSKVALYDEYIADRFYKLGAAGYSVTGLGLFGLFAIQDYSVWSWEAANAFILNLSAFFWIVFGSLIVIFSYGDYKESVDG